MGQAEIMIWFYEKHKIDAEAYWDFNEYLKTLNYTEANNARKDIKNLFYWAVVQRQMKDWDWTNCYRLSPGKVGQVEAMYERHKTGDYIFAYN